MTGIAYKTDILTLEAAKSLQKTAGLGNPPIAEKQFWYTSSGKLVIVVTVGGETPHSAILCCEFDRAIVLLYQRQEFDRWTYAPQILTKL